MDALDNFANHGHRIWQQRRVQGIFVCSTPTFEERVGHGRMGYRCVYGRVACPWFVKKVHRTELLEGRGYVFSDA